MTTDPGHHPGSLFVPTGHIVTTQHDKRPEGERPRVVVCVPPSLTPLRVSGTYTKKQGWNPSAITPAYGIPSLSIAARQSRFENGGPFGPGRGSGALQAGGRLVSRPEAWEGGEVTNERTKTSLWLIVHEPLGSESGGVTNGGRRRGRSSTNSLVNQSSKASGRSLSSVRSSSTSPALNWSPKCCNTCMASSV